MSHLPLVGLRRGKHSIRWPVLAVRFAVYVVIVAVGVFLVTWVTDSISGQNDRGNLVRLASISLFLAILFVVYDVRRDLRVPPRDLPELDREKGAGPE